MNSLVVGIAGYMGAGKTTCCRMLADKGKFRIIDGDGEAKKFMNRSRAIKDAIRADFGESVIANDEISYKNLGDIVFKDLEKLRRLNSIVHPLLLKRLRRTVLDRKGVVIIDAALLPIWNIDEWFDIRIWIEASFPTRLQRLLRKTSAFDEEEAVRRMRMQEKVLDPPSPTSWKYIANEADPQDLYERVLSYINESTS